MPSEFEKYQGDQWGLGTKRVRVNIVGNVQIKGEGSRSCKCLE